MLKFPIQAFFGRWNYPKGQFSFLKQAVQSAPELFNLNPNMRRVLNESAFKLLPVSFANQPWNSIELIESLITASESEIYDDVKSFLEYSSQQSPEFLLLGLSQIPVC